MPISLNRDLEKYGDIIVRGLEKKKVREKSMKCHNHKPQPLEILFMARMWQNIRYKSGNSHTVGTNKVVMPSIEVLKCLH